MLIGLMPLCAHVLLHFAAKPTPDWDDNWSADILFMAISNSGLSAVTVFTRLIAGENSFYKMNPGMRLIWSFTIICFCMASLLYGASVTGRGGGLILPMSIVFLVLSSICSLNFELAMAALAETPRP